MSEVDGVRIGLPADGWVPPPGDVAAPPRVTASVPMAAVVALASHRAAEPGRLRTTIVGGAVFLVLAAAGVAMMTRDAELPGPLFVTLPSVPAVRVSPQEPSAPASPAVERTTPPVRQVREEAPRPGAVPTTASPAPAPPSPSPGAGLPVVGTTLGLQPLGEQGRRVRHRNFVARISEVGPDSGATAKADSRFTVRRGRGDAACLSFESVNYPGYFLRSRDSALRLERAVADGGYDADATFCAVPAAAGGFVLRGRSSPGRYVTVSDSVLLLRRVSPEAAQPFVTCPPL